MNKKTKKLFVILVIVAVILFFVVPKVFGSGSTTVTVEGKNFKTPSQLPLNIGKDLKSGFSFVKRSKSRFGENDETITLTEYPDGTPVSQSLIDRGVNTIHPIFTDDKGVKHSITNPIAQVFYINFSYTMSKNIIIFQDSLMKVYTSVGINVYSQTSDPYENLKSESEQITIIQGMLNPENVGTTKSSLTKPEINFMGLWSLAMVLAYGKIIYDWYKYSRTISSSSPDYNNQILMLTIIRSIIDSCLNTDILTNTPMTGNGWDQYTLPDITVTKETDITPNIKYTSSKIKTIAVKYKGNDIGYSSSDYSKIVFTVNGSSKSESSPTAFWDNPKSLNYNVYVLNLDYPIVLKSLNIKLTCPNESASISDFQISIVYL